MELMLEGEVVVFMLLYILLFCWFLVSRFKLVFLTVLISTLNKVTNKNRSINGSVSCPS